MEKELPSPDSITTVQIKPEYEPSEMYASSEPPPAYRHPKATSVQVAKIIAVTVVLVSFILGGCILASAYITANASCGHLEQELQLLTETMDRYQPLQPEALVQEEPLKRNIPEELDTAKTQETKENVETENSNSLASQELDESSDSSSDNEDSDENDTSTPIKLPIFINFDDLTSVLMNNRKSKMNCVVEKKRAIEMVQRQPKTVNLPFGLNLTTDPRSERVTGEKITISCESGNIQQSSQSESQGQEDTIMIQPVMIPLPAPQFHTHMPMQDRPMNQMESLRPPLANPFVLPHLFQNQQSLQSDLPPNQILHQIAQQIIAQKIQQEEEISNNEFRQEQATQQGEGIEKLPLPEEVLSQINRLPNRDIIVAVSHYDTSHENKNPEVRVMQHQRQSAQGITGRQSFARGLPVDIPVQMMQQEDNIVDSVAKGTEQQRPHFLHPRSIRSVNALSPSDQKRIKRCNCDCAC